MKRFRRIAFGIVVAGAVFATDLTVHLPGSATVTRKSVVYQCEASGAKVGVPSGPFPVEYINGGGNSLAVVPVSGNALIFSNVMAASGVRYVAGQFTWWEAGGSVTVYSDSLAGKAQAACRPVHGH